MVYKVCIIGCGNIGSRWSKLFSKWPITHIAAYKEIPKTEVIGVCDIDIDKAKECAENWNVKKFYSDSNKMLSELNPDIVSICTPCENHHDDIKLVLKYNIKGIFCEKPISDSLVKAKEMIDLCKEKNIPLVINHVRRYDKIHNYVKENMTNLVGNPKKTFFLYSGGIINNGSHLFDLFNYYFGDVDWVQADKDGKDLNVLLKFKSGIVGSILSFNFDDTSIFDISIVGDKARLDLINKPFWDYDYRYFKKEKSEIMDNINIFSKNHIEIINEKFSRDFFINAINDLINCIENRSKPVSTGEDALVALELIMAAIYSSQNDGKRINVPFDKDFVLPKVGGEFEKWQKN